MDSSSTKQSGAPLTDDEKLMIINVYNYFSGANAKKEDHRIDTEPGILEDGGSVVLADGQPRQGETGKDDIGGLDQEVGIGVEFPGSL